MVQHGGCGDCRGGGCGGCGGGGGGTQHLKKNTSEKTFMD